MATNPPSVSFKETLNLPQTTFPIHANPTVDDPEMIKRWEEEKLFENSYVHNQGKEKFVLHDGPPYANGNLHLGHAYNKILKDIVTKSQRMMGKHVPVTPGWDCHGLPIEFRVTKEQPGLPPQELTRACRAYAQKWIEVQRQEFKQLGVLMNWDHPYTTMSPKYEADTLRAFGRFIADGYIERKNKTIAWCPSCQTALAAAEIEYADRKDPSLYVLFKLTQAAVQSLVPTLDGQEVNLLVWTTTPWTLPLNRAVLLKPVTEYVVLHIGATYLVVAQAVAAKIAALVGAEPTIVVTFTTQNMPTAPLKVHHPFVEDLVVPLLYDDSVMLEDGTACVHSAPGCGPEDYEVGIKNNLDIFSPISSDGKYTSAIEPKELVGMPVADGQIWVIKELAKRGRLFHKGSITHSYPHCWRCRQGLIFRATKQWFCDLSKGGLRQRTIEAVASLISFFPASSTHRLQATIEGRLEWCLSRQRVWGTPIPAFMCNNCDYTYVTQGLVDKVAQRVEQSGIEYWATAQPADLMPQNFHCPLCRGTEFRKEQDILDVWFDSGVSHFAVLQHGDGFPADMYLEGKDQHRGWFQSSVLTAMVLEGKPPMRTILTHGFTVDEKGRKMSKSIGNVISPQEMIEKLGTDGLRLWVASIDCTDDAVVSELLLRNVKEVSRKVRNTARFLLSNLYDFDREKDAVDFHKLCLIDQYALKQAYATNQQLLEHYTSYNFTAVFHRLADYCAVDLSAFYQDISKDRLYVERSDGHARRSAQTAYWYILDMLTKAMAPILSLTAEQISDLYQKGKQHSIHVQNFAWLEPQEPLELDQELALQWQLLKEIRSVVLKAIEGLREQGVVKLSLEAQVRIYFDETVKHALHLLLEELVATDQSLEDFLKEFFIVSQLTIAPDATGMVPSSHKGVYVQVGHAQGDKCPRCWQWSVTHQEQKLCSRCQSILGAEGFGSRLC